MKEFLIRRLLLFIPTLIGVSILIFVIMRVVPGDVALLILIGPEGTGSVTREALETVRVQLDIAEEKVQPAQAQILIVERTAPSREIASVRIVPERVSVAQRERVQLAALALDSEGYAIPGVRPKWEVLDPSAGTINDDGIFTAAGNLEQFDNVIRATLTQTIEGRTVQRAATTSLAVLEKTPKQTMVSAAVFPEKLIIKKGERFTFFAAGADKEGDFFLEPRFRWRLNETAAGSINDTGFFSAGDRAGEYTVRSDVIQTTGIPLFSVTRGSQYTSWIKGLVTGNPGESLRTRTPVFDEIFGTSPGNFIKKSRFILSFELATLSMIAATIIGIPLGVIMAMRQDTWTDYILRVFSIAGLAMPTFWTGTIIILIMVIFFNWLPPLGYKGFFENPRDNLIQMIWPVLALGYALSAFISRLTRSQMLEVLRQDYIRTAWAKGLRERVIIFRHAIKNAILPVITIMGLQYAVLLGGTVIMEFLFNLPGLGRSLIDAINFRDYPMVQALVILFALLIMTINLLVDISYGILDPRVRLA